MSFKCSEITLTGQGILVCFILLMFQCLLVSSSALPPISHPEYAPTGVQFQPTNQQVGLSSYQNGGREENRTFTMYQTDHISIQTFEYRMDNFQNNLINDMEVNCATITLWNTLCIDDEANCQLAKEEIQLAENAMIILFQSLYTMRRVCAVPHYPSSEDSINRCHKEESWSTGQGIN